MIFTSPVGGKCEFANACSRSAANGERAGVGIPRKQFHTLNPGTVAAVGSRRGLVWTARSNLGRIFSFPLRRAEVWGMRFSVSRRKWLARGGRSPGRSGSARVGLRSSRGTEGSSRPGRRGGEQVDQRGGVGEALEEGLDEQCWRGIKPLAQGGLVPFTGAEAVEDSGPGQPFGTTLGHRLLMLGHGLAGVGLAGAGGDGGEAAVFAGCVWGPGLSRFPSRSTRAQNQADSCIHALRRVCDTAARRQNENCGQPGARDQPRVRPGVWPRPPTSGLRSLK